MSLACSDIFCLKSTESMATIIKIVKHIKNSIVKNPNSNPTALAVEDVIVL